MSRTYKDSRIRKELNKVLQEKKSGPHKEKRWVICSSCKGIGCEKCKQEGIIYE